ncbi:hypothetical protein H9M94_00105 [Mycoplasma sp. Pen4]|uniref:hypothetical protein n=1 Tax=Mycoplasma sp. Pen4 TaxID=640330 RepID=UPI001654AD21|nr:hypothetical protein [Mycoplasma sp. Pen4]QNM93669.1 hypothetical protein H9M94_00105 [Mycoplasma sp. Pen4]
MQLFFANTINSSSLHGSKYGGIAMFYYLRDFVPTIVVSLIIILTNAIILKRCKNSWMNSLFPFLTKSENLNLEGKDAKSSVTTVKVSLFSGQNDDLKLEKEYSVIKNAKFTKTRILALCIYSIVTIGFLLASLSFLLLWWTNSYDALIPMIVAISTIATGIVVTILHNYDIWVSFINKTKQEKR